MKRIQTILVLALVALTPLWAHAQVTLTNPLGTTDVRIIVGRIISGFLAISGVIALIMFIYGGILWMVSNGKPENILKGKKVLLWAILGIIVITSAYVITDTVFQILLAPEELAGDDI